jgi:hypothetical protein
MRCQTTTLCHARWPTWPTCRTARSCHPTTIATAQAKQKGLRNAKKVARCKARQQEHHASGRVVVASDDKGRWKDEGAEGKEYQTSTKFFTKMQENVDSMVPGGGDGKGGEVRAKKKRWELEAGQASSIYRL